MSEFRNLKQYFYRLYLALLKEHIKSNNLIPSDKEEDCIKAYCVLTHAALEEYFEKISLETVKSAYKRYKSKKIIPTIPSSQQDVDELNIKINQLIKTLVLSTSYTTYSKNNSDTLKEHKNRLEKVTEIYKNGNILTMQDVSEITKKTDSYTKELIKETLKFHERNISENHGTSLKYLLKLLIPVGIDIPNELNLLNSLQQLAEYRGNYAHTQGNLNQILSARDVIDYIIDILKLCNLIETDLGNFHEYANL